MAGFWDGRRVLVTGHTGFKGAWLSLWLEHLGADVAGFALAPHTQPSLYTLAAPWRALHQTGDIRDADALRSFVAGVRPQIVFHLAAQALVRASYRDPLGTFATNVQGTLNLLEALRGVPETAAVIVITTDKVYANDNRGIPFKETDRLGGADPYSASKACVEIATHAFRRSFWNDASSPALMTVRAGNVIGGGDWSDDRIVPDVVRAAAVHRPVALRYPASVRPWLHVLEPLHGYLTLAERLATGPRPALDALNFGPECGTVLTVSEVVDILNTHLGMRTGWVQSSGMHPPEAEYLTLDSTAAAETLGWRARLSPRTAIEWTAQWYARWAAGEFARDLALEQIARYSALAVEPRGAHV
jgi:CDP-glucose 4,6-dehydratase